MLSYMVSCLIMQVYSYICVYSCIIYYQWAMVTSNLYTEIVPKGGGVPTFVRKEKKRQKRTTKLEFLNKYADVTFAL